ncbi:MAG TPA: hypothetical protein VHO72_17885 [Bacteroidales bacterium]|nr:hypothetical protein [Bacteroidales bacterium]
MKRHLLLIPTFLIAGTILLISCSKDGAEGPKGETGSANVIYSDWFTADSFSQTTIFGIKNFSFSKSVPAITKAIIDSGLVITYGKLSGYNVSVWPANQISALPIIVTYVTGNTQVDTWSSHIYEGKLSINFTNSTNFYNDISKTHSFRYVIIPGGVHESKGSASFISNSELFPDFEKMSYDKLCQYFHIEK